MNRRVFVSGSILGILSFPPATAAQSLGRAPTVGWLTPAVVEGHWRAFNEALRALGYVEGRSVVFKDARLIIDLAAKRRIPAVYEWSSMAEDGGLIAYGPTLAELDGRVASFVDRILKGAKPADLPVEQPTKLELVINLKTARAMSLSVPPSLVQRADRILE